MCTCLFLFQSMWTNVIHIANWWALFVWVCIMNMVLYVFLNRKVRWDFGLSGDSTEAKGGNRLQSSHGEATSYQSPNYTSRNQCKIQYVLTHSDDQKASHFSCINQISYMYTVDFKSQKRFFVLHLSNWKTGLMQVWWWSNVPA